MMNQAINSSPSYTKSKAIFDRNSNRNLIIINEEYLIGKENIITYYVDRSKNKFYCPFCRKNCMLEINSKITPIPVNKLRKEEFHCSCREPKYHSKKVDDITRLQKLFIDKKYINYPSPESEACLKDALDYLGIIIDIVENYRDAITKLTSKNENGKCPYYACWIMNSDKEKRKTKEFNSYAK